MTCRHADSLIEDVLNGDADAEGEDRLREHLSHCDRCSDAWHAAWQVRTTLNRCNGFDPGESYFEQATAGIMARIEVLEAEKQPVGSSPVIGSARYGPLQVRGVGLVFLMLAGLCAEALLSPRVGVPVRLHGAADRDVRLPAALDQQTSPTLPSAASLQTNADAQSHSRLYLHTRHTTPAVGLRSTDPTDEHLVPLWTAPPLAMAA